MNIKQLNDLIKYYCTKCEANGTTKYVKLYTNNGANIQCTVCTNTIATDKRFYACEACRASTAICANKICFKASNGVAVTTRIDYDFHMMMMREKQAEIMRLEQKLNDNASRQLNDTNTSPLRGRDQGTSRGRGRGRFVTKFPMKKTLKSNASTASKSAPTTPTMQPAAVISAIPAIPAIPAGIEHNIVDTADDDKSKPSFIKTTDL